MAGRFSHPVHQQPARTIWGTGSVRALADEDWGPDTVAFLSGQPAVLRALEVAFAKRNVELRRARVVVKSAGEPTQVSIQEGAKALREGPVKRVVGIGGGSVLDWCRLSMAVACDALDLSTGRVESERLLMRPALHLVPTTCATGAEAAGVAVYLDTEGVKVPVVSPAFVADRVVLDGQFLVDVSPGTLACFLGDALTHAVEAFVSIIPGTLAKEAACSAAGLILRHAPSPASSSRNERLMEAAFLGGVAASNCSVGVVHAFSHSVAKWHIPHGYANALALDAGMAANAGSAPMMEFATRLGFGSIAELRHACANLLEKAAHPAAGAVATALTSPGTRAEIIERMSRDVCLRTNPQRLVTEQLDAFLDDVTARLDRGTARNEA